MIEEDVNMARYHRYSTKSESDSLSEDDQQAAITRRRVQQLNAEIKIERPSESNYYSDKALRKAHKRRHR